MFHIPISALQYMFVYLFFIHIGEKRLGTSEDTRTPHLLKKGKSPHHKQRMRRERFMKWAKLSPQQVMWMLWKKNLISPDPDPYQGENGVQQL
ncbi:hypothetical protein AB205_0066040 [Aquarana catesbeiana]|uniref:Uncharacterized protein n=1 Tax=Aquarana catesbeiana TaxID=8400 RepID=A0A2G9RYI2_AQUCT|nr:hypothetical protein AB205_0066040 [Aquarana catesbeiana]